MKPIEQFKDKQYMNLETFRKNGEGVKTPVWFAQDGDTLRVWTEVRTGKVKRIRQNGKIRITPSTAAGEPLGEWTDANAVVLEEQEEVKYTKDLFYKKYGWMFNMFAFLGKMRGGNFITLKVSFS